MKMKVKIILLFILCLFVFQNIDMVTAMQLNNNNILITEVVYQKLLNLGFTDDEISNMTLNEIEDNKKLQGKILSQETVYLTEQDFTTIQGMQAGYIETTAKKMTTTIISIGNKYRYKVSVEWKIIPTNRSYDVIGIGIDNNVKIISNLNFKQNFCYTENKCASSIVNIPKITQTGAISIFQLPTQPIISLSSYLYFDVIKNDNSNFSQLNAYGDYSHSIEPVVDIDTINPLINRIGILLNNSILNYYDSIPTSNAVWINYF